MTKTCSKINLSEIKRLSTMIEREKKKSSPDEERLNRMHEFLEKSKLACMFLVKK